MKVNICYFLQVKGVQVLIEGTSALLLGGAGFFVKEQELFLVWGSYDVTDVNDLLVSMSS